MRAIRRGRVPGQPAHGVVRGEGGFRCAGGGVVATAAVVLPQRREGWYQLARSDGGKAVITSVRLKNFKNFADETLRLGPFTVIVGANASGKSNIRDAFRFIHGIGRGYRLAEIIGGRYGPGGNVEWEQIRGAAKEIMRFGHESFSIVTKLGDSTCDINDPLNNGLLDGKKLFFRRVDVEHEIEVGIENNYQSGFQVTKEKLHMGGMYNEVLNVPLRPEVRKDPENESENIYDSHPPDSVSLQNQDDDDLHLRMAKQKGQKKLGTRIKVRRDQPALTQIQGDKRVPQAFKLEAQAVANIFSFMRFLDPMPDLLRLPSFPGQIVLGDSGENLPTVLQGICTDKKRKDVFIEWVRELTPMDVEDLEFPVNPVTGQIQLVIRETNGRKISAYAASDGTLRFLAMLAALLSPNPAQLYFFEEIENGLHPSRLHLLLDLIETQTAESDIQVITTTHSPELLSMMSDKTFKHASVVCRLPDSVDSVIRPVSEIPRAEKLRKSQGLGRLLTGGWMENMLAFGKDGRKGTG